MMIAGEYDFTNKKEKFIKYIESIGNKLSVAKNYSRQIEMILEEKI